MNLRRLSWAGVEATANGWRVLVDPLEDTRPLRDFAGPPLHALEPVTVDERTWALVTHVHRDHCDRQLLARLPAGRVLCHEPVVAALADVDAGLRPVGILLWKTVDIGPFRVTPVPGQDWRGDDQVSWIIEADGVRVIHCGDTIWHGRWYEIARRFMPVDVALLPINGFIAQLEGFTPTEVPSSLTPEQAVEAAAILEARTACAIHHGLFNNPPLYTEQPNATERFLAAGLRRGIRTIVPGDGERIAYDDEMDVFEPRNRSR